MAYDYAHGKIDNIAARKQEIQLEEAFLPIIDPSSKESRLTILMDGAPGVGKTTISRKVCIDWANGKLLQEYQLMILVPLREVIINKSVCEKLVDILQGDPELKEKIVQHLHKTYGANILFIFDGYDELSSQQRNVQSLFLDIMCTGINEDQLVFNNEELKTSRNALSLGLLNAIETFTISGSRKIFQFLHLTIQEFLAARHIASGGMSAVEKAFTKSHINNQRFRMTLLFLSGLTHLSFIPPGESLLDGQTIGLYEEAKFIFLAQLLYASNNSSSQWLLSSLDSKIFSNMSHHRLSQCDCLVLAHFFSSIPQDHVWEAINFFGCDLTDDCLETLLSKYHSSEPGVPAVTLTTTFDVSHISVTGPSVVSLFTVLGKNTCLKSLELSCNDITVGEHSEAVGQAIEGMLRVNQSLQVLKLNGCRLDNTVIGHIATGLTHNTTLQELDISDNCSVTNDLWVQLFPAIQKGTTSLKKLDISVNNLQSEGQCNSSQSNASSQQDSYCIINS